MKTKYLKTSGIAALIAAAALSATLGVNAIASAQTPQPETTPSTGATAESAPRARGGFGLEMRGSRRGGGHGANLATAATAIGIDEATLRTELQAGKTLAAIATANGKTAQVVIDALVADAQTRLAQAVTEGRMTQPTADARLALDKLMIAEQVNTGIGVKMGDMGGRGGRGGKVNLTAAATVIGIDAATLRTELSTGKTLAAIATANGKTAQAVIDALVAEEQARLTQSVTDGRLTQAQADARLERARTKITTQVNGR
jgi:hypothetical protein